MILSLGCGTMKKEQLTLHHKASAQKQVLTSEISIQHSHKVGTDSVAITSEYRIWPKGSFKYSPIAGFEGEATHLAVRQQQKSLLKHHELKNRVSESKKQIQTMQNSKALLKSKSKMPSVLNYGIGVAVLVVLMVIIWLYRKYKRKAF